MHARALISRSIQSCNEYGCFLHGSQCLTVDILLMNTSLVTLTGTYGHRPHDFCHDQGLPLLRALPVQSLPHATASVWR
jgi:hypothetical protein